MPVASPQLHFWDWSKPILQHAVAELTRGWEGGELNLSHKLLLVPTAEAGRRLREALAISAGEREGAVVAPWVWHPEVALSWSATPRDTASPLQEQLAWQTALSKVGVGEYASLFPLMTAAPDTAWISGAAQLLGTLARTLGAGGHSMESAAQALEGAGDHARWSELAALEKKFLAALETLAVQDVQSLKRHHARHPQLPEGVREVLVFAVSDPPPLLWTWLEGAAQNSAVSVFVHAPEKSRAAFTPLGVPDPRAWGEDAGLVLPLANDALNLCPGPQEQAACAVTCLTELAQRGLTVALGACDPALNAHLTSALTMEEAVAYDPAGRAAEQHALTQMLRVWQRIAQSGMWTDVASFLRMEDVLQALCSSADFSENKLLRLIDELHASHLPPTLDDAAALAIAESLAPLRSTLERLQALVALWKSGACAAALRALLEWLYGEREFATERELDSDYVKLTGDAMRLAAELDDTQAKLGTSSPPHELLGLLLHQLEQSRLTDKRGEVDFVLHGWLELPWEPAPGLVIAGFNEEYVPGVLTGDAFLPDSLRGQLGLPSQSSRRARDAFLLRAMIEQRREQGALRILLGRVNDQGDALRPSRLLFDCGDADLVARVRHLFPKEDDAPRDPVPPASIPFVLRPPRRDIPLEYVSPSSLGAYLACPFHYYLDRVLGTDEIDATQREASATDFGNLIHEALRLYATDPVMQDCVDKRAVAKWLDDAVVRLWRETHGAHPLLSVELQMESARQRLAAAAEAFANLRGEGWRTLHAEQRVEDWELQIAGVPFSGKLDRVDQHVSRDAILIWDYKTGSSPGKPRDAHLAKADPDDASLEWQHFEVGGKPKRWTNLQLPLYVWAMRQRHPHAEITAGYFVLPPNVSETSALMWEDLDEATVASAVQCAEEAVRRMQSRQFWPPAAEMKYGAWVPLLGDALQTVDPSALLQEGGRMKQLQNAIIRASAGSGKTFQLVRRYLRLLALGESPEGIVAMTFTRKAAREFFERILQKLAELAHDPSKAVGYLDELAAPGAALALLRKVIRAMDRLRLGTIDSFFASVARCFPFELGLAGQATIMAEDETARARADVMNALLVDITREGDGAALREMLEAWKRATTGRELHSPATHLQSWFSNLHPLYLESPDALQWGSRETIWPDRDTPVWKSELALEQAIEALRDSLNFELFTKKGPPKWEQFFSEILIRRPGEPLKKSNSIEYMLCAERLPHGDYPLLRLGSATWSMFGKSPTLDLRAGAALAEVLEIVVGRELMCRVERTQGRRSVVARFDAQYERRVRGRGRLAFADLTWLLSGRLHALNDTGDNDSRELWEAMQRDWEYRLDGKFQHWLFDEFQDTSRRQWEVVASLVDEAASDPEGRRSFFAVGDLKQSLYLFRQAEPELFLDVESRYAKVRMEKLDPLTISHRSSSQVLEMVNAIFKQDNLLRATVPDAMHWWRFEEHSASEKTAQLSGHAALLTLPEADYADEDAACDEMVAALIRHIAPLDRGLTCAVLVRTNDEAARLTVELRRLLHVEVVCESQVAIATDNPVTLALLSVFKLAVHPADESAENHLRMSPLEAWFTSAGKHAVAQLGAEVRRGIAREGFLATARVWADRLRAGVGEWDAFSKLRLAQFFDLAAEFDASETRDVDAFLTFAQTYSVRAAEHARALQVMTVHKSKGLEFDVVIMPEIQRTALDQPFKPRGAEALLVQRDARGVLEWLLDKPPTFLIERDARLAEAERQERARLAYQSLCRLYVGMTRAIRGLYIVLPPKENKRSEADLLKAALTTAKSDPWDLGGVSANCWWESGRRDWFTTVVAPDTVRAPGTQQAPRAKLGPLLQRAGSQLQRRSPSGEESFRIRGGELLSERRETSRQLGTLVHELFAFVPWLDGVSAKNLETEIRRAWTARDLDRSSAFATAAPRVLSTLANPDIRSWFQQKGPAHAREAWCERSFDMLHDHDWISGTFDRVVLDLDAKGRPTSATILDFKTDDVTDDASMAQRAAGYAPQLALYIGAVRRLTGLPEGKIRTALVFTSLAKLHWLPS